MSQCWTEVRFLSPYPWENNKSAVARSALDHSSGLIPGAYAPGFTLPCAPRTRYGSVKYMIGLGRGRMRKFISRLPPARL